MFRRNRIVLLLLILLLETAPFLLAAGYWKAGWAFGGFIANPVDGATYLAKMQEGWAGRWEFSLLYSAAPAAGAPIYLFYIFLGHLARVLGLSLVVVFHGARVLAAVGLFIALAAFCERCFPGNPGSADRALWLAAIGSGMGWIGMLFSGQPGADLWVAEGYPFLTMFVNPHFPIGLALLLWIAVLDDGKTSLPRGLLFALAGLLLAIVQPFALVIAALIQVIRFAWVLWTEKKFSPFPLVTTLCLSGPFLGYEFLSMQADPVFAAWTRQNVTPAPALLDLLLSLSPALIPACFAISAGLKNRKPATWAVLSGWLVAGTILVYLPLSIQRRFMTGLYVPVALLAVSGLDWLQINHPRVKRLYPVLMGLSLLTNLLFLALVFTGPAMQAGEGGGPSSAEKVYIPRETMDSLLWLREYTPLNSVILADSQTGLFVPAWSGRRTVYGHPFETPNAEQVKAEVDRFYSGEMDAAQRSAFLGAYGVDFVLYNRDETAAGGKVVFDKGGMRIVEVTP